MSALVAYDDGITTKRRHLIQRGFSDETLLASRRAITRVIIWIRRLDQANSMGAMPLFMMSAVRGATKDALDSTRNAKRTRPRTRRRPPRHLATIP